MCPKNLKRQSAGSPRHWEMESRQVPHQGWPSDAVGSGQRFRTPNMFRQKSKQCLDNIWTTFGQHYSIWTLDSAGTNLQSWFSLGLRRYFRRQQGGRRHLNSDIMGPPRRLNKTIKRITICLSQTPCIQLL